MPTLPIRYASLLTSVLLLLTVFVLNPAAAQDDQQPAEETDGWPCKKKIDPSYIEVTEGSGGQILMLDPSETSRSMVLMEAQLRGIEETVFRAGGKLAGRQEYVVPVDSSIEIITFSAFVQCIESIAILLPDGSEFKPGQGGPGDNVFRSGRVFTLEKPVPGDWRVRVAGKGFHSVVVLARTELSLDDFDFVKEGGRPGHEGYFPTREAPVAGVEQMVLLRISGTSQAVARLVSASGQGIQDVRIVEIGAQDDGMEIYGKIAVPAQPFRILVEGRDVQGLRWQRLHEPLWTPRKSQ